MAERDPYEAVLADLKAERARLDLLIAGLEAKMTGQPISASAGSDPATSVTPAAIHADTFYGLSIIDAAKKFLKMATRAQHLGAIATALEQGGLKRPSDNVLSGILVRAAKGREVTKVGKGMWGLSEWYPKLPKEAVEKKKPEPRKPRAIAARSKRESTATEAKESAKVPTAAASTTSPNGTHPPSYYADECMKASVGKPLHVRDVLKYVNDRGCPANRGTVESVLKRRVKQGKMTQTGPSTYLLAAN